MPYSYRSSSSPWSQETLHSAFQYTSEPHTGARASCHPHSTMCTSVGWCVRQQLITGTEPEEMIQWPFYSFNDQSSV